MIQTLFLLSLSSGTDPTAYARVVDAHLSVQTAQGKPLYRYALPKLPSDAALDEVMIDRSTKRCAALFENNDLKWFVLWARPGAPPKLTRTGFGVRAILSTQGTGWVYNADNEEAIPPGKATRPSVEGEYHFMAVGVQLKKDPANGTLYALVNGAMLELQVAHYLAWFDRRTFKQHYLWENRIGDDSARRIGDFIVENGQVRVVTTEGHVLVRDRRGWRLEAKVPYGNGLAWISPNCLFGSSNEGQAIFYIRANPKSKFVKKELPESIFDRYRVAWSGIFTQDPLVLWGYAGETPVTAKVDRQGKLGEVREYTRQSGRIAVSFE